MNPPLPRNEAGRLKSLHDLGVLDTPPEADFDDIVRLAAEICGVPIATISLIDEKRQWFKAKVGLAATETPRELSFCAHALDQARTPMVVRDARQDHRFATNPLVTGEPNIRFYAGSPLVMPSGEAIGTLCVIDQVPRELAKQQLQALGILSNQVVTQMRLRRQLREQARVEEALKQNEQRLHYALEGSDQGVWDWNLVTNEVYFSPGWCAQLGHAPEEISNRLEEWSSRVHPDDLQPTLEIIRDHTEGRTPIYLAEIRMKTKAGDYRWIMDRGKVIARDADGRPTRMVGTHIDITERREAERMIREQAALIDEAHDAIVVRDFDHRIRFWSKGAERLYGWTAAQAVGLMLPELLGLEGAKAAEADRAVREKGRWSGELTKRNSQGVVLPIDSRWTLLHDEKGRPEAILSFDADITDRKRLEQQFLRAQRTESIGTLAGGIAHDLNNLLTPIMVGVELLKQDADHDPLRQELLQNIERSARRGSELVKQVLSFARGVEGQRVPVQFKHIVHELEEIARSTFPKNIRLQIQLPADLWAITGDPTQLNQVLLNLCVNARDAMPHGGQLTISAANIVIDDQYAVMDRGVAPGRYVCVQVTDEGTGIPPEMIDRIFEPFFTTKAVGQGTGLGLSTTQGIVRSHGGFLNVYSEPGKGTTFKVYLPANAETTKATEKVVTDRLIPRGNGETILLVDDEASIISVTRQTLEAFGYRVLVAEDGAQAIAQYATHRSQIALVLTDMMMPVMDGPALIAALRRISPQVPIIAASGLNANGPVARAAVAGVQHFLAKPYSADALLRLVKEVLTATGGSRPPVI